TLRGDVLAIGGLKEKVLAARRAGIRTVVMPKANARDLTEIPKELSRDLKFIFASRVDDVLKAALGPAPPLKIAKSAGKEKKPA
ncbi:MAG: S16 family serine protease, partial [Thermoanaerobaculia bacterium]